MSNYGSFLLVLIVLCSPALGGCRRGRSGGGTNIINTGGDASTSGNHSDGSTSTVQTDSGTTQQDPPRDGSTTTPRDGSTSSCSDACSFGSTRCSGSTTAQTCVNGSSGCTVWQTTETCTGGDTCSDGECITSGGCTTVTDEQACQGLRQATCTRFLACCGSTTNDVCTSWATNGIDTVDECVAVLDSNEACPNAGNNYCQDDVISCGTAILTQSCSDFFASVAPSACELSPAE